MIIKKKNFKFLKLSKIGEEILLLTIFNAKILKENEKKIIHNNFY